MGSLWWTEAAATWMRPRLRWAHGWITAYSLSTVTDHETAHTVETVAFSDLTVEADGIFARSQSGSCIEGGFYGPGHAEAAGIFEQSDIVGAFGAKRQ